MSALDDLRSYHEVWAKYNVWRITPGAGPLVQPSSFGNGKSELMTSCLPYQIRRRLLEELNALLPGLIERLQVETRAALVEEVKAEAKQTLAELES